MCNFFFLALFEGKTKLITDTRYWINLTLAGYPVSGLSGYPAGQSGIRPDTV
jgi:hypothetical protein